MAPMNRAYYPDNWEEIARKVKEEAQWKCEECGRECRRQGESLNDFIDRLVAPVHCKESYDLLHEITDKPQDLFLPPLTSTTFQAIARARIFPLCAALAIVVTI